MLAVQNCIMAGLCWEVGDEQSADGGPNFFHLLILGRTLMLAWFCSSWLSICVYHLWIFLISLRVKFSKGIHRASNKNCSSLSVLSLWCFFCKSEIRWVSSDLKCCYRTVLDSLTGCAVSRCFYALREIQYFWFFSYLCCRKLGTVAVKPMVYFEINKNWAGFFFFCHLASDSLDLIWSELAQLHWCWRSFYTNSHQLNLLCSPVCAIVGWCFFAFLPLLLLPSCALVLGDLLFCPSCLFQFWPIAHKLQACFRVKLLHVNPYTYLFWF